MPPLQFGCQSLALDRSKAGRLTIQCGKSGQKHSERFANWRKGCPVNSFEPLQVFKPKLVQTTV
jgi:hypothetical protein